MVVEVAAGAKAVARKRPRAFWRKKTGASGLNSR
jgi:hypothetical protein